MQHCSNKLPRQFDYAVLDSKRLQISQGQALGCSH